MYSCTWKEDHIIHQNTSNKFDFACNSDSDSQRNTEDDLELLQILSTTNLIDFVNIDDMHMAEEQDENENEVNMTDSADM